MQRKMKKITLNTPLLAVSGVAISVFLLWLSTRHGTSSDGSYTAVEVSSGLYKLEIPFKSSPIEVKYELPPKTHYIKLEGALLFAHGCSHSAGDMWPKSKECPECLGLPEETAIRKTALKRGFAIIAISSMDRSTKCWTQGDIERVAIALSIVLNHTDLKDAPLYALGASSGGSFILTLASLPYPKFTAICSQIMSLHPAEQAMESEIKRSVLHHYPSTLFVHMSRDVRTAQAVNESMSVLTKHKISTKEIKIDPSPMTPEYLFKAIGDEVPIDQSRAIFEAFVKNKVIDGKGFLVEDPRSSDKWKDAIESLPFYNKLRLEPDESPIAEELNVLWGYHEIISSTTEAMLDWFGLRRNSTAAGL